MVTHKMFKHKMVTTKRVTHTRVKTKFVCVLKVLDGVLKVLELSPLCAMAFYGILVCVTLLFVTLL